jgi:Flp pilus assembly protein TadD
MQVIKSENETNVDLATKYLAQNKNFKAKKYLTKLLNKEPTNDEAWMLLGIANRRMGKLEEAIKCLKITTELNDSKLEAWGLLTMTLIDKGELKEAEAIIEKAGKKNPYNPKIQLLRENLVRIYTKFGPFF